MNEEQINEVAELICNTWDFCGNVTEVVKQWGTDNDIAVSNSDHLKALDIANKSWNVSLEGI